MDELPKKYSYQSFTPGGDEIRLFEFKSSTADNRLAGKFSLHSLKDDLDYDALSYTWGDSSVTLEVLIEDVSCLVGFETQNASTDSSRSSGSEFPTTYLDRCYLHKSVQ
jgi:hypothetical protein